METHVTRKPVLGELRQHILTSLIGNPLFTDAKQLRANHFVHECEDVARLERWHAKVLAEVIHRTTVVARQRRAHAIRHALRERGPTGFRQHRPRWPRPAPIWRPGTPLPCRPDYQAGIFDRRAAARFQQADSLQYAHLLTSQPQ